VQPGDDVQQGQPLAVITSGELAELRVNALDRQAETTGTVQEAETNLQLAKQTYRQQEQIAQTSIEQAQTELRVAQEQYSQDQALTTKGALPRRDFLESEARLATAKNALVAAQSRLEVLDAGAERDRAQTALEVAQSRADLSTSTYDTRLDQLGAEANEDGTITITAPIAGRIADREVSLGQSAQDAGAALMTIIDDRTVLASANVYEKDLKQVAIGQPVRVKVSGLPDRTFRGEVTVVGALVEGVTRVIPVKAEIDNTDGALKPGMFADIEMVSPSRSAPVLAVPRSALTEINGQQNVYVKNGGGYQPVEVTLGKAAGEWVEVKDGLFEGDQIVTQRVAQLYAQSLRGGGKAEAAEEEAVSTSSKQPPWWIMLPVGGAIAAGAFWIGRRSQQTHLPQLAAGPQEFASSESYSPEPNLAPGPQRPPH
jgi:membrane fusion protein, heavy metal efflux system